MSSLIKKTIYSNLRYITSGKAPTAENLPAGNLAFGFVDGVPTLFGNDGKSGVQDLTRHLAAIGVARKLTDGVDLDAVTEVGTYEPVVLNASHTPTDNNFKLFVGTVGETKFQLFVDVVTGKYHFRVLSADVWTDWVVSSLQSDVDTALASAKSYTDTKVKELKTTVDHNNEILTQEIKDRADADARIESEYQAADRDLNDKVATLRSDLTTVDNRESRHYADLDAAINAVDSEHDNVEEELRQADQTNRSELDQRDSELQTNIDTLEQQLNNYQQTNDRTVSDNYTTLQNAISNAKTDAAAATQLVQDNLDKEIQARENADTALESKLQGSISAEASRAAAEEQAIRDEISEQFTGIDGEQVLSGWSFTAGTSDGTVTLKKKTLGETGETSDTVSLPGATSQKAGLMTSTKFAEIESLKEKVATLQGQAVRLSYDVKSDPSAADISAFVTEKGYTSDLSGVVVVVQDTYHVWRYYEGSGWKDEGLDTVTTFTTTSAGIILGSTEDGEVAPTSTGTGRVRGWQEVKDSISQNATNLTQEIAERKAADTAEANRAKGVEGDATKLTTTAKNLAGAINEVKASLEALDSANTTAHNGFSSSITTLNSYVPTGTTSSNKLVNDSTVRSYIRAAAARFITPSATGSIYWSSFSALSSASSWYVDGESITQLSNTDYAYYLKPRAVPVAQQEYYRAAYEVDSSGTGRWREQCLLGWIPTDTQQAALDSGVTAAKLTQIDTNISKKLDKVTSTATYDRAYSVTAAGAQSTKPFTSAAVRDTLVLRDNIGRAQFASPEADADAATKKYVDDVDTNVRQWVQDNDYAPNELATAAKNGLMPKEAFAWYDERKSMHHIYAEGFASKDGIAADQWMLLAQFPATGGISYGSVNIDGRIGGWNTTDFAYFNAVINNQNDGTFIVSAINSGNEDPTFYEIVDFVFYKTTDGVCNLYIKLNGNYLFDLEVNCSPDGTAPGPYFKWTGAVLTTAPDGTLLSHTASNSPHRMELRNGQFYVASGLMLDANTLAQYMSDYLKKTGGQMTGALTWKNTTALPDDTAGTYFLTVTDFASGGTTKRIANAAAKTALGIDTLATTVEGHTESISDNASGISTNAAAIASANTEISNLKNTAATHAAALTANALVLGNGGGALKTLANGAAGKILKISTGGTPEWADDQPGTTIRGGTSSAYLSGQVTLAAGGEATISQSGSTITITANGKTYSAATQSAEGLMSAADKKLLDSIGAVWADDGSANAVVDRLQEVLTVFKDFSETTNLSAELAKKANTTDVNTALGKKLDAGTIATATTLGLVKSSTTGTTADRDYKVQVLSDGTMKVNVPWEKNTDTNTTYTLSLSGSTLTLTPSSGSAQTVNIRTLQMPDTRSEAINPSTLPTGVHGLGLKSPSIHGISGEGGYAGVISVKQWADASGGQISLLAFTDSGVYHNFADQKATSLTTANWKKLAFMTDVNSAVSTATTNKFVTLTGGTVTTPEAVSGFKNFSNGLRIGNATLTYNATSSALEISFS